MSEPVLDGLLGRLLEDASVGIALLDSEGRYSYVNDRLAEINDRPADEHIGRSLAEVIPHLSDVVERFHEQVMSTREPVRNVQIRGSTPGTPNRAWQVSYLPVELAGGPGVGVVLIDVSEREDAVAAAAARARQHAAVADLGQRGLAGEPVEDLLQSACDTLVRELDGDLSGVLQFSPDRSHMVMCSGCGWPDGAMGVITAQNGRASQAGFTLLEDGPVVTGDMPAETRFKASTAMLAAGVRSSISTPILGESEPFGVLGVFSYAPDYFDADDAAFVRATANVLGAAVVREEQARTLVSLSEQRGRLVAQALDAGERGQRQIADVLHDDVLQHLLYARQELSDAGGGTDAIERAQRSVGEAAELLRRVVAGLHPVTLAHGGLTAALESLASEHDARSGLRTGVEVAPAAEGHHDRLIVSLVRELLTNVTKHANASRAQVIVTTTPDAVLVAVADDGAGMSATALESALLEGNIGLAMTRERVEALGGLARVGPGLDGRGVGIEIELPTC